MSYQPVPGRILIVKFLLSMGNIPKVQTCYVPTGSSDAKKKKSSYEQLRAVQEKLSKDDIAMVMIVNMNAVGSYSALLKNLM